MKISIRGIAHLKSYETFSAVPYDDGFGFMTVGYGHKITKKSPAIARKDKLTTEEGELLLAHDVAWVEKAIEKQVTVPLTQPQYDALCGLIFNIGETNFGNSTLLRELNAKRYIHAGIQFLVWHYSNGQQSGGLLKRRDIERDMFMSGTTLAPVGKK